MGARHAGARADAHMTWRGHWARACYREGQGLHMQLGDAAAHTEGRRRGLAWPAERAAAPRRAGRRQDGVLGRGAGRRGGAQAG